MKISNELRAALRSAARQQRNTDSWDQRRERRRKALDAFLKSDPKRTRMLASLVSRMRDAGNLRSRLLSDLEALGLSAQAGVFPGCLYVNDDEKFVAKGGKLPEEPKVWTFDMVMAQLATATPKEGAEIIKKLGINWE